MEETALWVGVPADRVRLVEETGSFRVRRSQFRRTRDQEAEECSDLVLGFAKEQTEDPRRDG